MTARRAIGVRAKRPPAAPIANAREARDAFEQMLAYRRMERNAHVRANGYAGGTASASRHRDREDAYSEVADAWEERLRVWLQAQAGAS